MIILEEKSDTLLDVYSNERAKPFQMFVEPQSTQNKLRLQSDPETVHVNWLIRQFNGQSPGSAEELAVQYFKQWRVNMREIASKME
ncbi:hypothetical protein N7508_010344 [Penicillium antarcticum]|nr:uncharacterized protein N7508_010344 [Penicillium antarcticum]KAJ5295523.1 hypothetical protein N7508_010344 [Penicillium antarcticum]